MPQRLTLTPEYIFALTEDERTFLDESVKPFAEEIRRIARAKREGSSTHVFTPEPFWEAVEIYKTRQMLIYGIPEEYGGYPISERVYALMTKELCRADAGIGLSVGATYSLFIKPILFAGTKTQKQHWVSRFTAGELIACYCQTEEGAGSDVAAKRVKAIDLGNGAFSISGEFTFITNGSESNAGLVMVVSNPDSKSPAGRFTMFIVDFDQAIEDGTLIVERNFEKLGLHHSPTTILRFDDVLVTQDDILGDLHGGWKVAMNLLTGSRATVIPMQAVGMMAEAIDLVDKYVEERKVFGYSLDQLKNIKRERLVMATRMRMAEALSLYAAAIMDAADEVGEEDSRVYEMEASAAKLLAGEWVRDEIRRAFQIFAGIGYMMESRIAHLVGDSFIVGVYEGTSQVQSMLIIKSVFATLIENMGTVAKAKAATGGSVLSDKLITKLAEEWPFWKLAGSDVDAWEGTPIGQRLIAGRSELLTLIGEAAADPDFGAGMLRSEPRNQAPVWFRIAEAFSTHLAASLLSLNPSTDGDGASMQQALIEVEIAFAAITAELKLMQSDAYRALLLEEPSKS